MELGECGGSACYHWFLLIALTLSHIYIFLLKYFLIIDETENMQREKEKEKKRRAKLKKKELKEKDEREAAAMKVREEQERLRLLERKAEDVIAAGNCAVCELQLFGRKTFDIFDNKCCSTSCISLLRRKLAAEAAEKRFSKK